MADKQLTNRSFNVFIADKKGRPTQVQLNPEGIEFVPMRRHNREASERRQVITYLDPNNENPRIDAHTKMILKDNIGYVMVDGTIEAQPGYYFEILDDDFSMYVPPEPAEEVY